MGWDIDPPKPEAVRAVIETRGAMSTASVREALRATARVGAPGWVDHLAEFVDVHQDLGDGRTTLHEAAAAGHWQLAERLVELGADPSRTDARGQSAVEAARPLDATLAGRLASLVGFGRACRAIHTNDVPALEECLQDDPGLVRTRVLGETLTHVVVLWPAHRPQAPALIEALDAAGADLSAHGDGSPFEHQETPLHSAVSANDVAAATALIDLGADLDAPGAVLTGGPPLSDAVVFRQWAAAHLLVNRGCQVHLPYAAALGRLDLVRQFVAEDGTVAEHAGELPGQTSDPATVLHLALWFAAHGAQLEMVRWLHERGADLDWVGPTDRRPRDLVQALASGWAAL